MINRIAFCTLRSIAVTAVAAALLLTASCSKAVRPVGHPIVPTETPRSGGQPSGSSTRCASERAFLVVDALPNKQNARGGPYTDIWEIRDHGAKRAAVTTDHASWSPAISPDGAR